MENKKKNIKLAITAITLFCGLGGGTLGLMMAQVKELLAIDNWSVAQKVFEANFIGKRKVNFWNTDIGKLQPFEILRRILLDVKELGIMLLSPPCQGFSVAKGVINPLDPRNKLFLDSISLIAGVLPKCFIIENVPGMEDPRNISILNEIKRRIAEQLEPHYEIRCFKLCTLNFGVPQKRFRLIFIGYLKEFGKVPTPPTPDFEEIASLRIVDIAPEIDAIKVGQSKKTLKSNTAHMNTITATDGVIVYSKGNKRSLTVKENKDFATFPDWFKIPAEISDQKAHKLFGNTIPPMFMKAIVENIKNDLGDDLLSEID